RKSRQRTGRQGDVIAGTANGFAHKHGVGSSIGHFAEPHTGVFIHYAIGTPAKVIVHTAAAAVAHHVVDAGILRPASSGIHRRRWVTRAKGDWQLGCKCRSELWVRRQQAEWAGERRLRKIKRVL